MTPQGGPRASFHSSVAASQVYPFVLVLFLRQGLRREPGQEPHCQLLFLPARKELEPIPEELGRMAVDVV